MEKVKGTGKRFQEHEKENRNMKRWTEQGKGKRNMKNVKGTGKMYQEKGKDKRNRKREQEREKESNVQKSAKPSIENKM